MFRLLFVLISAVLIAFGVRIGWAAAKPLAEPVEKWSEEAWAKLKAKAEATKEKMQENVEAVGEAAKAKKKPVMAEATD